MNERITEISFNLSLDEQFALLEQMIRDGKVDPDGKPLAALLCEMKLNPLTVTIAKIRQKVTSLPVPEWPQNAGEAACRQKALQLFLKENKTYEEFLEMFGPQANADPSDPSL